MLGTASNSVCYTSQFEAANAWCSSVNVSSPGGLMSCSAVNSALPSDSGGRAVFNWTQRIVSSDGAVLTHEIIDQVLLPCETYGYDYFEPLVYAGISLFILVFCGRVLTKIFNPSSEDF